MGQNRIKMQVILIGMLTIVTVGGFQIIHIKNIHDENLVKTKECINSGKTVVMKDHLLTPTEVKCEKN